MNSLLLSILISIFFINILLVPFAEARRGCCSHHGGVCGCKCCDGTSFSAKCRPYYPSCNVGRGYYVDDKVSIPFSSSAERKEIPEDKGKLSSQIKQGMTKIEVIEIAGKPHHVTGLNDSEYEEKQRAEYGFVMEIWHYILPEQFTVYFKDDKVYEVRYKGNKGLLDMKEQGEREI